MKRYFSRIEKAISTNVEETESDGSKQEKATSAAVKETESDGSKQASTFPPVNAQSSSVNQSIQCPPTLQNKDQDIVNAIHLVKVSKRRLQDMRDNGWEVLFQEAVEFCSEQSIEVPNINDVYVRRGKSKRINERVTCLHHFQAEVFYTVIDMQLQEINNRFDEVNCQLLLSMTCLSPQDSFKAFDKDKLMQLATFYPNEFPPNAIKFLDHHLNSYICDLPSDDRFKDLKGVDELAKKKMVETNKHKLYPSIYLLIKLTLIQPVATASVERSFNL